MSSTINVEISVPTIAADFGATVLATTRHALLLDRDDADGHPIAAITGLQQALDDLALAGLHSALTLDDGTNPHGTTASDIGLGSVEDVALSTWAGSTALTTLGTVATGTWQGSQIGDDYLAGIAGSKVSVDTTGFAGHLSALDDTVQKALATLDALTIDTSPLTTKGDLYAFGADDDRLPVGTDGQVLTADSAEALGVKWADQVSVHWTRDAINGALYPSELTDNFGLGTSLLTARLHIVGQGNTSATYTTRFQDGDSLDLLTIRDDGFISVNNAIQAAEEIMGINGELRMKGIISWPSNNLQISPVYIRGGANATGFEIFTRDPSADLKLGVDHFGDRHQSITINGNTGNVGIRTTTPPSTALHYVGEATKERAGKQTIVSSIAKSEVVIADTTVADTTTETEIYSVAIPAGYLTQRDVVETVVNGVYSTGNASDTFTVRVKLNGVTVHSFVSVPKHVTDTPVELSHRFTVRGTGVSGSIESRADFAAPNEVLFAGEEVSTTVDTTAQCDLSITMQWGSASASNTGTIKQGRTVFH